MIIRKTQQWFLAIDKPFLILIMILISIGCFLVATSSPVIASKLHLSPLFFLKKHIFYMVFGFCILLIISALNEKMLRYSCLGMLFAFIILLAIATFWGFEIKGARRWINIAHFNMQPSEFLKPFYIVIMARILSLQFKLGRARCYQIALCLHLLIIALLLKQPDLGMTVTYTVIFISMIFLSGLSIYWLPIAAGTLASIIALSYIYLPHVTHRLNSFLYGGSGANYQVEKSMEAYMNGGIFGQGPLGGSIKHYLPDCHTDFIFAVAGEELGGILSALVIGLITVITIRMLVHSIKIENQFKMLTVSGIAILYAFQCLFNIGVTLNLLPTKGMTLPLISYGGSSTLSFMIAFGIVLNFTKRDLRSLNIKNSRLYQCAQ